ncbi:Uncharacterised protein [Burkholderia pseudomallei]|nr:hypothetical protein [Burkholderia pseudomallei]AJX21365.1 hypothetical protein BG17_2472 [Burkholderia pseudomallei MSHR491]AJX77328.1 hypothetical protein BG16_1969 [Burkholderia pseudomallei MSHR2543]EDU08050.1 hypothetical protein BURPS1655_E0174 [Burkholderia pseudomallei 1655]KGS01143.1 hypothetical protein X948_3253 [Burkholderia pseudomallei MSHR5608]KGS88714.1 hypothetical protein X947_2078 [Burkholderia pseudomallei MSHR7334]KGU97354.1 hypothetical protein X885_1622 [Burkholderia
MIGFAAESAALPLRRRRSHAAANARGDGGEPLIPSAVAAA